jgi:hypothetical protein
MKQRLRQGREAEYGLHAGQKKRIVRIVYSRYIGVVGLVLWSGERLVGIGSLRLFLW